MIVSVALECLSPVWRMETLENGEQTKLITLCLWWVRFLSQITAFLTGHTVAPYVCSLATLTRSVDKRFCSLTHFAQSFVEQLKFLNMCSWLNAVNGNRRDCCHHSLLETRPISIQIQTVQNKKIHELGRFSITKTALLTFFRLHNSFFYRSF